MKYLFIFPGNIGLLLMGVAILCWFSIRHAAYTVWHLKQPAPDRWKDWYGRPEGVGTVCREFREIKWRRIFIETI